MRGRRRLLPLGATWECCGGGGHAGRIPALRPVTLTRFSKHGKGCQCQPSKSTKPNKQGSVSPVLDAASFSPHADPNPSGPPGRNQPTSPRMESSSLPFLLQLQLRAFSSKEVGVLVSCRLTQQPCEADSAKKSSGQASKNCAPPRSFPPPRSALSSRRHSSTAECNCCSEERRSGQKLTSRVPVSAAPLG